ncbi:spore germination protein [Bacillus vallismortis]|uniref:Spore germination protein n=1 Tax=Bacillus vallismortis TaxID=72361 RepID=A0AAP3CFV0_BACVA|nr:spore germination protein [Bacillus vallismortis]MCY7915966.1 spore germination protein [Bacillus vallismortis]MCY8309216.1 spore germination protein [Bacillus vallismortis]MCY8315823.1 spore germination protein [Bacillus vallismortis]MCY8596195.1 spore germination protein [Bacillus vallismortis]
MEKAQISIRQLFVMIIIFELGSSLLITPGTMAGRDAWIAVFLGCAAGLFLFYLYQGIYQCYPDFSPKEYMDDMLGTKLSWIFSFLYILYFAYIAARVLRDFGEMLLTFAYHDTPIIIVNALLMVVSIYAVRKGIEVLARSAELLFGAMYFLGAFGLVLLIVSGSVEPQNLKPVLADGFSPIIHSVLTQTMYVPFGEVVLFVMIFPYLSDRKGVKKTGMLAMIISGLVVTLTVAINISVLDVDLTLRSQFPLLSTIQTIKVEEFLDRLDVFFMLALIIGGFFKVSLYLYAVVVGTSTLFKEKNPSQLAYPMGFGILLLSITIATNFSEHLNEGLKVVPLYIHLPFQLLFPLFLFIIAVWKKKRREKVKSSEEKKQ